MPRRYCGSCRSPPARRWRSQRVWFPAWGNPMQMTRSLALIVLTARASVSPLCARGSLSFQRATPPLAPSVFFLPGTCEEKTAGQRFSAPGWERAHAGSDPACLAFATQRGVSRPFFPTWPASLCKAWAIWVSFGGSDDELADDSMSLVASDAEELSGSVTDLAPSGLPAPPKPGWMPNFFRVLSKAVEELGFGVVSTRGALSQPSGWVVSAGAPSGPSATTIAVLPWSSRRAHEILALPLLCPPPYFRFIRPHYNWRRWRKGIWEDASAGWAVAAHLCPPTAIGWKAKSNHPSKPCRTTSALAGRSYASAGQAASVLHSMAPELRRLSSPRNLHLPFPPLSLLGLSSREGVHAQPDATPLRSARAPDPR